MEIWLVVVLVAFFVNVILSALVAYVAEQKRRSGVAFFFLSFFLTFIAGILIVLALPPKTVIERNPFSDQVIRRDGELQVRCPFCAEWVNANARVCKHCGRDIASEIKSTFAAVDAEKIRARDAYLESQDQKREMAVKRGEEREAAARRMERTLRKIFISAALVGLAIGAVFAVVAIVRAVGAASDDANLAARTETPASLDDLERNWRDVLIECGVNENNWEFTRPFEDRALSLSVSTQDNGAECVSDTLFGITSSEITSSSGIDFGNGYFASGTDSEILFEYYTP